MLVEIIAYAPTAFYHCRRCEVASSAMGMSNRVHQEQLESSLPEDLQLEYLEVSDWIQRIFQAHGNLLAVKVIDAPSMEGVLKSLRYGTRRAPAVIVDRRVRFSGKDALTRAANEISRRLANAGQPALRS